MPRRLLIRGSSGLVLQARSQKTSGERKAFRRLVKAKMPQIEKESGGSTKLKRDIIRQMWRNAMNPKVAPKKAASVAIAARRIPKFPDGNISELVQKVLNKDQKAWETLLKLKENDIERARINCKKTREEIIQALREHIESSKDKNLANRAYIYLVIRNMFNPNTGKRRQRKK